MVPSIPPPFPSRRGRHSPAITVSSGSDLSVPGTVIQVSSSSPSVVVVPSSSDSDEATSGLRMAARRRRPPPPPSSAGSARSPVRSVGGSNGEATSGPVRAARRRRAHSPPSSSAVTARSTFSVAPSPFASGGGSSSGASRGGGGGGSSSSGGGGSGASRGGGRGSSGGGRRGATTERHRRKYKTWSYGDEREILRTYADLRKENMNVLPQPSVLLKKLRARGKLSRRIRNVPELSDKLRTLKKKLATTAAKVAANGGQPLDHDDSKKKLYEMSQKVWQEVYADFGASYLAAEADRRGQRSRPAGGEAHL